MTWEDLKHELTENLIEYMKCKVEAGYEELAKAAYVALNFRFRTDVEDKARKIGRYWGFDREVCDLLVEKAFKRFYQYPFKFTKSKCATCSFDECVKLYLYRIVQNCFKDYHRELFHENTYPYDGMEEVIVEFPKLEVLEIDDEPVNFYKNLHQKMKEALNNLTPNHKIIYLTYKAYEKKGFKLPRILLGRLREVTGLSQSSIRVYKKQSMEIMDQIQKQHGE